MITVNLTTLTPKELHLLANYVEERARICGIAKSHGEAETFSRFASDVRRELQKNPNSRTK